MTTKLNSCTLININNIKYNYIQENDKKYITSTEQNQDIINRINIILSNTKELNVSNSIVDIIIKCIGNKDETTNIQLHDKYYIFPSMAHTNITKCKLDKNLLWINYNKQETNIHNLLINDTVPKELILSKKQQYSLILSEIEKVNSNMDYPHYIYCNNDNIMDLSFRFVYNEGELGSKLKSIFEKFGYNYFEINFKLHELYPFMPPDINYIKPKIDTLLISNIYNLDIWDVNSWNYAIPFDWIISNLGKALEPHFNKYLDINNTPYNLIELNIIRLNYISKIKDEDLMIDFKVMKFNKEDNKSKEVVWKSGTGFGYGSINYSTVNNWDISKYINIIQKNNDEIVKILIDINQYLLSSDLSNDLSNHQLLYNFILHKINGINLLNFNNNIQIYKHLIEIVDTLSKKSIETIDSFNNFIKLFTQNISKLIDEFKMLLTNNIEDTYICVYLHYIDVFDKYNSLNIIEKTIINNKDLQEEYIEMVKSNLFDSIDLNKTHRYYLKKNEPLSPKSIMRIMSELASLKNDLPVSWGSSVILRMVESNSNLISFIIVGPKDTPYHNGLFEFHAYFPDGYPNKIPLVNINTTDNGRVRFNPNLYACGKVCLSLLGTWSGEKGESWIPEISTFFQVIISIQSLILVDNPYFNEPAYETTFNTEAGKKANTDYNDNIRYETVRVAMIGMLKNKPESYENFIEQHFKLKKDEILSTVQKWVDESNNKIKFQQVFDELKTLL